MLSPVFLRGAPGRPSWTARERASWPQLCAETGHRGPSPRQDMRFVLSPEEAPPERPAKSIRETPPKAPFPHPLTCSLLQGCSDHQRTQEATRAGARQGACRRGSEGAIDHPHVPPTARHSPERLGIWPSSRGAAPLTTAVMFSSEARGPPVTPSGPGVCLCHVPAAAGGLTTPSGWERGTSVLRARLPGHRLRDGPRAHWHLHALLPLLSPGVCQHVVLVRVKLEGVVQLHGGDQVRPKHLERGSQGH